MTFTYDTKGVMHIVYDSIDDIEKYCKKHKITYAEYQKNETMILLRMKHGKREKLVN